MHHGCIQAFWKRNLTDVTTSKLYIKAYSLLFFRSKDIKVVAVFSMFLLHMFIQIFLCVFRMTGTQWEARRCLTRSQTWSSTTSAKASRRCLGTGSISNRWSSVLSHLSDVASDLFLWHKFNKVNVKKKEKARCETISKVTAHRYKTPLESLSFTSHRLLLSLLLSVSSRITPPGWTRPTSTAGWSCWTRRSSSRRKARPRRARPASGRSLT